MKRKITLLFAVAMGVFASSNAQTVLNESFTATWSPSGAGWSIQNNSIPIGTSTWFQGNPAAFPANSGATNDYYACNYQSQGSGAGNISNFLVTPTLSLVNGAVFQFATRTVPTPANADRLQILMSQGTGTGAIGTGTAAVGTFTTNLLDINPNLTLLTNSAVSSGSVNGFPNVWTVYSLSVTGITGTVTGRFAFRYFVADGGAAGANSDYMGIDDVSYTLPCAQPTLNINPPSASFCSGGSATFFGSGATTYTWSTGVNTSTVAVSPTVSTVYTLMGSSTPGCTSSKTVAVTVTLTPVVAASNVTTCASTSSTLTASGASTYLWNTGATTSAIVVSPPTTTNYTVTGNNGICANTKTVTVTIGSNLSINITPASVAICNGNSTTLTASGATSYSWNTGATSAAVVVTPTANTTYTVGGLTGACTGANTVAVTVNAIPNVSITLSSATVCTTAGAVTVTASGASTYTWAPFASNATVVAVTTPTNAGTYSVGVTGTSSFGCIKNYTAALTVVVCTGLTNNAIENSNVVVYPNPFTNEVTISGVNGPIEVINTLGQVVLTALVSEKETINTTNLAKGIYFIKVKNADTKSQIIKVIKD